jgi:hypothetical protein
LLIDPARLIYTTDAQIGPCMANLRASEAWLHDAGAAATISIFGVAIITLSWTSAAVAATTPTVPFVVARIVSASAITKTRELTTTGAEVRLA